MYLVLLTSQNNHVCFEIVKSITNQIPGCHLDIYFEKMPKKLKTRWRAQIRHIRRNGLIWIPYRLLYALFCLYNAFKNYLKKESSQTLLSDIREMQRVTLNIISSFHSDKLWEEIKHKQYDLGIVFGTRILKKELFSLPKKGMINIHQGLTPWYRGQPPGFWELYNEESESGITIHQVTEKLDAGAIILQKRIKILPGDTLEYLTIKLNNLSIVALPEAIKSVLEERCTAIPVDLTQGKTYTITTLKEILELKKKGRIKNII